jgi:hypothetical protein
MIFGRVIIPDCNLTRMRTNLLDMRIIINMYTLPKANFMPELRRSLSKWILKSVVYKLHSKSFLYIWTSPDHSPLQDLFLHTSRSSGYEFFCKRLKQLSLNFHFHSGHGAGSLLSFSFYFADHADPHSTEGKCHRWNWGQEPKNPLVEIRSHR